MPLDTRKIPQSDWDRHQHTIRALYHNEKLPLSNQKGDRCVVSVMREEHGFTASLSQYEAQLRRWESQKNLKKHEWAFLLPQYDAIVARGCQARIISSGFPLSESRIIRARRHLQNSGRMSSVARAPPQAFVEYQDSRRDWIRCSSANQAPDRNQPSIQMPATLALPNPRSLGATQSVTEIDDDLEALQWPQSSLISRDIGSTDRHESTGSYPSPGFGPSGQLTLRESVRASGVLGRCHSPVGHSNFRSTNGELFLGYPRNTGQPSADCLVTRSTFHAAHVPVELGVDVTLHPIAQQMIGQLSFLASNDMGISSLELSSREPRNDVPTLVKAIAYSFSNRTEVSRRAHHDTVFGLLRQDKSLQHGLQELLQTVQPSVGMCLADNLFRHAVETGDPQATNMILGMARSKFAYVINPDRIKCTITWRDGHFTPLEVASAQRNIELARVLLEVGADPNHSFWKGFDHIQGALESALWTNVEPPDTPPPLNTKLVYLFLGHQPRVRPETLRLLLRYPLIEGVIVKEVIGRIEAQDHGLYFPATAHKDTVLKDSKGRTHLEIENLISNIVETFQNSTSLSAIVGLFSKCDAAVCGPCAQLHQSKMSLMIQIAARRGNIGLVEFMLPMVSPAPLQELLVAAIRSGEKKLIDLLLESGATVDGPAAVVIADSRPDLSRDEKLPLLRKMTPLAEAISCQDETLVRRLEDLGALSCIGIGKEEHFRATTTAAAYTGNILYLQKLLEKGSELDGALLGNALEAAIANDHYEATSLLLVHVGADVGPRDNILLPALGTAVSRRNKWAFDLLIEFMPNAQYYWHLSKNIDYDDAILWGNIEVLNCLALLGIPSGSDRCKTLTIAVLAGNKVVLEWLLEHGGAQAEVLSGDLSPLAAAAVRADAEMVELLINKASVMDDLALMFSMLYSEDIFKTLLSAFTSQFPEGSPGFGGIILTRAVHGHKVYEISQLLKARVDTTAIANWIFLFDTRIIPKLTAGKEYTWKKRLQDETKILQEFEGLSALGYAIIMKGHESEKQVDMLRMLLEAGGDLNRCASNSPFQTPLLLAIRDGKMELLPLLVQYGADVNLRLRGMRHTPLQLACQQGSFEMVAFLLQRGADVRAAPSPANGGTALQMAGQSGNIKVAQLLIDNGANVHEPPCQFGGRTAFEGAAKEGRITMLEFLWSQACPAGFPRAELERARSFAEEECHRGCVEYIDLLLIVVGDGRTPKLSAD
ncbi:hypothetical protein PG999_008264 [Apiospora kogelbergensis]|uniref:Clr5 domain-containing protein n=1 Tax=Apiospora kogelbergensis TaxID=1337665 RepID=A0AAW0QLC9_9PEZI